MKFFGHADLQKNQIQQAALQTTTFFPTSPVVGQIGFVNSIVYICTSIANDLPVWVPLTREITAYTHTQSSASATWTVNHGLNTTSASVQVFDSSNRVIIPNEIEIISASTVSISLGTAITGRAVAVTGHFDGSTQPAYSYTHYQSEASTSWVIVHGLGYNPIVRVIIGDQEVQPASITFNNANQLTITFSTAQAGYSQLI